MHLEKFWQISHEILLVCNKKNILLPKLINLSWSLLLITNFAFAANVEN